LKVLVCGGREFSNRKIAYEALDMLDKEYHFDVLIDGMARGADELGFDWALSRGVKTERYAADWASHGRAAGPIRNKEMLDKGLPDLVVAFPGGPGTANMIRQAENAGVLVKRITITRRKHA
jgi:hypothetical protein